MPAILLTGATGALGAPVLAELLGRGHTVRCLTRSQSAERLRAQTNADVEIIESDLSDLHPGILDGIEHVVHCAAWLPNSRTDRALAKRDPSIITRTNLDATCKLAALASAHGATSFTFISSTAAAAVPTADHTGMIDETSLFQPNSAYGWSKYHAEQALLDIAQSTNLRVVILRPPMLAGPGLRDGPLLSLCKLTRWGLMPVIGDARALTKPLLHINDLAAAIRQAIETPAASGCFYVHSGARHQFGEMIDTAARLQGRTRGHIQLPKPPIALTIQAVEWLAANLGTQPPVTTERLTLYLLDREISIARAKQVLGFAPANQNLTVLLEESLASFRATGQL